MTANCSACGATAAAEALYCRHCGKPLTRTSSPPFRKRGMTDRLWTFFTSVRVATVIIFVLAAAAIAGTLIEQEGQYSSWMRPADYYPFRYGELWGALLYQLGLTRMYGSWWFLGLLILLGLSLVICSIDRFVPLWRLVQRPPVKVSAAFALRQGHRAELAAPFPCLEIAASRLRWAGYRVRTDGKNLFADRGHWSRWGPYITHIGLLMILLAGIFRYIPGFYFDTVIAVADGQTVLVPYSDFAVRSDGFTADFYPDGRAKGFATDAVIIEGGNEIRRQLIEVNNPLTYKRISLFQSSYQSVPDSMEVHLTERESGQVMGSFQIDLAHPDLEYPIGELTVKVLDYFPNFALDEANRPVSRSGSPENPAFYLQLSGPGIEQPSPQWFFAKFPDLQGHGLPTAYRFKAGSLSMRNTSILRTKMDQGVPLVYLGSLVVMIGLILAFYLSHRRIWVVEVEGKLVVGGDANRHQALFGREFKRLIESLSTLEGSKR